MSALVLGGALALGGIVALMLLLSDHGEENSGDASLVILAGAEGSAADGALGEAEHESDAGDEVAVRERGDADDGAGGEAGDHAATPPGMAEVDAGRVRATRADAGGPRAVSFARDAAMSDEQPAGRAHPRPRQPPQTGAGFLTLDSEPWSEVWLGDRKLGLTPLAYFKLPAGRHRLLLKNPAAKLRRAVWVEIQPGKTTVKRVPLGGK